MVGETLLACEGSPADVTCIRFLSRVDPLMLLQVVFPGEALVAILAHEWTVTSVGLSKDAHNCHYHKYGQAVCVSNVQNG